MRQFEVFAYAEALDPEDFSGTGACEHQLSTPGGWNLRIDEEILQFNCGLHADGLKAVARQPMP